MAFDEDLTAFMDTDVFAVVATATTRHGEVIQFPVIFDNGYQLAGVGPMGMASSQPVVTVKTADVADMDVGRPVEINGASYTVAEQQPDGTGMSVLFLEKA